VPQERDQRRALANTVMNLRFHKILGCSWVATQVAASQEGLISMSLYPVLVSWFARLCLRAVRSLLWASQREQTFYLPFLFCFQYNMKFRQADYSTCHLLSHWFLVWLILRPWRWRRYVPPKCWLTCNGLHSVISQ
jgi:hypothetical protein